MAHILACCNLSKLQGNRQEKHMDKINYALQPREKLLVYGASSLSDQELLAIFLRTGVAGFPVLIRLCLR